MALECGWPSIAVEESPRSRELMTRQHCALRNHIGRRPGYPDLRIPRAQIDFMRQAKVPRPPRWAQDSAPAKCGWHYRPMCRLTPFSC